MKIDWNDKEVLRKVDKAIGVASKKGAELVLKKSIAAVPVGKTGDLKKSIKIHKSDRIKNSWAVGVFSEMTGKWENSIAARAVFVEYGHAAPGDKRGPKITKPQSFLRTPLRQSKRQLRKFFIDAFKKLDRDYR